MADHYKAPDWFVRHVFDPLVAGLTRLGVAGADKPPIPRAHLKNWAWETRQFLDGASADSGEDEPLRIAPDRPVFRLEPS